MPGVIRLYPIAPGQTPCQGRSVIGPAEKELCRRLLHPCLPRIRFPMQSGSSLFRTAVCPRGCVGGVAWGERIVVLKTTKGKMEQNDVRNHQKWWKTI